MLHARHLTKTGGWQVVNGMDASALDLLAATLIYEPSKRMSAKTAMQHRYFDDLDKNAVANRGIVNQ
jgi:hypothetical protein